MDRTYPNGRVVGIDIIPAQPPKGVSTIQGNFLSQAVQDEVKRFLKQSGMGTSRLSQNYETESHADDSVKPGSEEQGSDYDEMKGKESHVVVPNHSGSPLNLTQTEVEVKVPERMVDVVLSDMSAPWEQTDGFWKRSLSNPYFRMMNTSGLNFRDHAGSMVCEYVLSILHGYFTDLRTA